MITVVSAAYGNYDQVIPPPAMPGVEFVMVTNLTTWDGALGWQWVHEPRPHLHPRMAAKYPKCFPWLYAPHSEVVIWADASVEFKGEHLKTLVDACDADASMYMWSHPWRQNIADEAEASHGMPKYLDQSVHAQVHHYYRCDMPLDYGMWATGLAVYQDLDQDDPGRDEFAWRWLAEQVRWTYQDQLSLPYVAWLLDRRPGDIPEGWHLDNPWLTFRNHRSEL